jgi:hypothetical protein
MLKPVNGVPVVVPQQDQGGYVAANVTTLKYSKSVYHCLYSLVGSELALKSNKHMSKVPILGKVYDPAVGEKEKSDSKLDCVD